MDAAARLLAAPADPGAVTRYCGRGDRASGVQRRPPQPGVQPRLACHQAGVHGVRADPGLADRGNPAGQPTAGRQTHARAGVIAMGQEDGPQQVPEGRCAAGLAPGRVPAPWPGYRRPVADGGNATGSPPSSSGGFRHARGAFRRLAWRPRFPARLGQRAARREQHWVRGRTAAPPAGKAGDGRPRWLRDADLPGRQPGRHDQRSGKCLVASHYAGADPAVGCQSARWQPSQGPPGDHCSYAWPAVCRRRIQSCPLPRRRHPAVPALTAGT